MTVTVEEVKAFIEDAKKEPRQSWLTLSDRSWQEIKKRDSRNRPWPYKTAKKARYPAWYSIFKIRQPLVLSRIGIPIGKDTTKDGSDPVGACAAIGKERLAINLAKNFDFFDYLCACRDDFLATNFAIGRAYYERDEVKERVKERISPIKAGNDYVFVNAENKVVESDEIYQDAEGYYIEKSEVVDVENEKICLEHILYRNFYPDPGIRRWNRCRRMAFECHYSEREFKDIFGAAAFNALPKPDPSKGSGEESAPKRQSIVVYEYWDEYDKVTKYLAKDGEDFLTPKGMPEPKGEDSYGNEERNGIYDLDGFFPTVSPLMMNMPTDEFWPIPEYAQLVEIIEDIHTIFSRMILLTRAIRIRLLYDKNVEGLGVAIKEATEGEAFGVPNLMQALQKAGGNLDAVVQYVNVEKPINSLNELYKALEQRLNVLYKLTGTSDLLQGLITDPTQRTFGERQMTEKYALNQLAEPQRKMAEFVRGSYQLMTEMALKNFKDDSIDKYVMPETLPNDLKKYWPAARELLKTDLSRFRIELETDSTIALNEEYDKKMRIELVNALTAALEKTANIARTNPALVEVELHALKYLIQGFRQGKLFQAEVTEAIDKVIKLAQAQKPAFDKEQADFALKQEGLRLEEKKAALQGQLDWANLQLQNAKNNNDAAAKNSQLELEQSIASLDAQMKILNYELDRTKAGVEIQNKLADNNRLELELATKIQEQRAPKAPQIVVLPSQPPVPIIVAPQPAPQLPAPAPQTTIINTPPQTSVVQPVEQVPIPVPVPGNGLV